MRHITGVLGIVRFADLITKVSADGLAYGIGECGHDVVAEVVALDRGAGGGIGEVGGHAGGKALSASLEVGIAEPEVEPANRSHGSARARRRQSCPVEALLQAGSDVDALTGDAANNTASGRYQRFAAGNPGNS